MCFYMLFVNSLVDAAREEAAIDSDDLPIHKAGRVGREKNCNARQFIDVPKSTHWRAQKKLAATLSFVEQLLIERGTKDARRDRVDTHSARRPLNRQRLRQRSDSRFARRICRDFVQRHESRQRCDIDDAARACADQRPATREASP
jgi:hypothetical protein